ncbi:MAG: proton-conducting transporter membrane subunit [Deltaproteobacteria bacterium]
MQIAVVLGVPVLLAATVLFTKSQKIAGFIHSLGYLAVAAAGALLLKETALSGAVVSFPGFLCVDALGAFFIFVVSVVAFAAALYSIGYIDKDARAGVISQGKARAYYVFFDLFCFSMLLVPSVDNLGVLWVAVEMTTLISAFLVGFYNSRESVEAAWKYIIICSVGIIFALLGTILFSYALSLVGGAKSLNWSDLTAAAGNMDKGILKVAFLFILVGYGTKAGLAPMHTWLPDAHSQAVSPISALLSGVLLKTALYAILRFGIIVIKGVGFAYFGNLMVLFGLVSLVVSCGFILVQKDLKRLLAYSSIEHVAVICIGFGLGAPLAAAGALFHVFNHAVTKSFMFFGAGDIVGAYRRHDVNMIRGVIRALPFAGVMAFLGVFALAGFPPFSLFVSEMMILAAAFVRGAYGTAAALLLLLAVIFGAFIHRFGKMLFGDPPPGMAAAGEPLSGKIAYLFLFALISFSGAAALFLKENFLWTALQLFRR